MENKRVILSFDDAVAMLADGDRIHVTSNPARGMMIGADWDREAVLDFLRGAAPELAGPIATAAGHGLALLTPDGRRLFFATQTEPTIEETTDVDRTAD